jgi:hypothetical protein
MMPEHDENAFEELQDSELFEPSYIPSLRRFYEAENIDADEPIYYVYKFDNPLSGSAKELISKTQFCEPPDEEEIGRMHGSGRYLICASIPKTTKREGRMRAYKVRLHKRYDDLKRENERQSIGQPFMSPAPASMSPAPASMPGQGMADMFGMLERMVAMFTTMINPLLNRPRDENVKEFMKSMYSTMGEAMQSSMSENLRMMAEMKRIAIEGSQDMNQVQVDTTIEQEQQSTILSQIIPLLSEFLPKILGGGAKSEAVREVVRMTPQFKRLIKDRAELVRVIQYLDQSKGTEETNRILSALKVARPGVPKGSGTTEQTTAAYQPGENRAPSPARQNRALRTRSTAVQGGK